MTETIYPLFSHHVLVHKMGGGVVGDTFSNEVLIRGGYAESKGATSNSRT